MVKKTTKRPTISDVAKLAGVSKGAVSRTFSGKANFSESTIARIRAAADELGWRPSAAAQMVNGAPAQTIGMVVRRDPGLFADNGFFPELIAGIQSRLIGERYSLSLTSVSEVEEELEAYESNFREGRIDGFLVADLVEGDQRFELLARLGAPAVVIGRPPEDIAFPLAYPDADAGVTQLLEAWIAAGHERIAHVAGDLRLLNAQRRRDIWAGVLERHGLRTDLCEDGEFSPDLAPAVTRQLMESEEPPTAIFYANDEMAVAGIRALVELGYTIPEDVAVAGVDGIPLGRHLVPSLATVVCGFEELGRVVTDLLLSQLRGGSVPEETLLEGKLTLRESAGLPVVTTQG